MRLDRRDRRVRGEVDWAEVDAATGLSREEIVHIARMIAESKAMIVCWAMGLTQHKHAVPTIREITNVVLLRGMIGKPGAGLCPAPSARCWHKVPPRATLSSCMPRQMPSTGSPAASAAASSSSSA